MELVKRSYEEIGYGIFVFVSFVIFYVATKTTYNSEGIIYGYNFNMVVYFAGVVIPMLLVLLWFVIMSRNRGALEMRM